MRLVPCSGWFFRGSLCLLVLGFAVADQTKLVGQALPSDAKPAYLDPSLTVDQRVDDLVSRMTLEEKASQLVHQASAVPRLRQGRYDGVGLDFWAPNLNIFRDPRWGRGQETYGEDPYLTARMAVAYVTGMQGDDPKYLRVISTPKHYAVHSGPEPSRHTMDVKVSKHDEEDTYLPAFRAAVTEGRAGSVMCAYNRVNGEPACANTFLLQDQLRAKWGFQGYVVSDCDAVADIQRGHHYVPTLPEAAAVSLKRGTDLDCNEPGNDYSRYVEAVKQGLLTERELDVAVKRLFRARFELGMFDPPAAVKYAQTPFSENDSDEHRQLALQVARETLVLLKNDGVLPLKASTKTIAVVGPLADQLRVLEGNYNGVPSRATTVIDGIRAQFAAAQVTFSPGTTVGRPSVVPVPGSLLRTEAGEPGLKGEYFSGTELAGTPMVTRVDGDVNFDEFWSTSPPQLGGTNFSVRWTGILIPAKSGIYQLGATGDDGFRLWLDGKLLVEDWSNHPPVTKTVEMKLEKGRKYTVKMEYYQAIYGAVAKLVWSQATGNLAEQAVAAAKHSDVIVAVVGITSDMEGEESDLNIPGFKGGDRTSLDLPKEEEDLLQSLKSTGKPLVVVLVNGSALAVNWAQQNANAILEAWYPGEEGGKAVAETLAGLNNPAGRLPVTFYKGIDQLPAFEDYSMNSRTYRYFKGQPLYPFGYGLSYSQFKYSDVTLSASNVSAGDPLEVDTVIQNTSRRDGDEVAELYLSFPESLTAPIHALRAFTRLHLAADETRHVHFTLSARELSQVNDAGDDVIAPGAYRLSVGGGQPGTGAPTVEAHFTVEGEKKLPE